MSMLSFFLAVICLKLVLQLVLIASCNASMYKLRLNVTVNQDSNNQKTVSLFCYYQSSNSSTSDTDIRVHRGANELRFMINDTLLSLDYDHGLANYREWVFEKGAVAEFTMPNTFFGMFSCKSMMEISSTAQLIVVQTYDSVSMIAVVVALNAGLIILGLLIVCLVGLVCYLRGRASGTNLLCSALKCSSTPSPKKTFISSLGCGSVLCSSSPSAGKTESLDIKISPKHSDFIYTEPPKQIVVENSKGGQDINKDSQNGLAGFSIGFSRGLRPYHSNPDINASSLLQGDLLSPNKPSLPFLMNHVAPEISSKWKAVGIQLGIRPGCLDQIQQDYWTSFEKMEAVFSLWARQPPGVLSYEWTSLYEVLNSRHLSENHLANSLELLVETTTSNASLASSSSVQKQVEE